MRSVWLKRSAVRSWQSRHRSSPKIAGLGTPGLALRALFQLSQSSPTRPLSEAYNFLAALLWKRTEVDRPAVCFALSDNTLWTLVERLLKSLSRSWPWCARWSTSTVMPALAWSTAFAVNEKRGRDCASACATCNVRYSYSQPLGCHAANGRPLARRLVFEPDTCSNWYRQCAYPLIYDLPSPFF